MPGLTGRPAGDRLIICFDGTGNVFKGTPGDTNIVKIYNMFDRGDNHQMHYYQPGIGTYPAEGPVNVTPFRAFLRKIEAVLDSALATSFDSHVIAGYNFIMRYYKPGDRIYIFGFSRGAFTARFVARMIAHVGLLSKGNEELVPFAYKVYQDYERNREPGAKRNAQTKYMNSFKKHFCRTEELEAGESHNESGIKVEFLGLFDCVSSVGNLDIPFFQKAPPLPAIVGTAKHIRHAVAIDERRVKFKAALFQQEEGRTNEDIKEVWFPGNHGDIGGGWDNKQMEDGTANESNENDYFQLSDISLKWMIDEIDDVEKQEHSNPEDRIQWNDEEKASFLKRFHANKSDIKKARMHDTLTYKGGSSFFKTTLWKWMETLPFIIKRWEYLRKSRQSDLWEWRYISWPLNLGGRRDIPSNALFHQSVLDRLEGGDNVSKKAYTPNNHLWVKKYNGADGDPEAFEQRNLAELVAQLSPAVVQSNSDGQKLTNRLRFKHEKTETIGSVAIDGEAGEDVIVGIDQWDRLYSVQKV